MGVFQQPNSRSTELILDKGEIRMKISNPFRLSLLVKLIITLSLLGILNPFPELAVAESLLGIRGMESTPLTFTAAREIARDANGHWYVVYKKKQESNDGILLARTNDGKPVGVGSSRTFLSLGETIPPHRNSMGYAR
jgi:hypothetical protein